MALAAFKLSLIISSSNAFKRENQKPRAKFKPGLALIGFRTTGPRIESFYLKSKIKLIFGRLIQASEVFKHRLQAKQVGSGYSTKLELTLFRSGGGGGEGDCARTDFGLL